MKNKNLIYVIVTIIVIIGVFMINMLVSDNKEKEASQKLLSGKYYAEMEVKDYGTVTLELDADIAPITVTNFVNLVKGGFYDGLTFHRIIDGFMVQGGDPEGTGFGGSKETITGEFAANGIKNEISHVRGVISMARSENYNSASSQFFIMHQDRTSLDGQYAAFGRVISGMEVIDELVKVPVEENSDGAVLKENQPIIEKIEIITLQ